MRRAPAFQRQPEGLGWGLGLRLGLESGLELGLELGVQGSGSSQVPPACLLPSRAPAPLPRKPAEKSSISTGELRRSLTASATEPLISETRTSSSESSATPPRDCAWLTFA
eukprot:scaffold4149_cov61-Phaeocystis_antarctica.AAC.2